MRYIIKNCDNCYYKQLQRMKAENERLSELSCANCGEKFLSPTGAELYEENVQLKEENERLKAFKRECLKPIYFPDVEVEVTNKYKQALEEIREMCISHEKAEKIVMANEIITKINEVLK